MMDGITSKDKLDTEIELMKLAWSSFDRRREFEWKFTIALWTGLSAFIGIFLTRQVPDRLAIPIGASVTAVIVFLTHLNFSLGLGRANNADRGLQYFYEREVRNMIGVTWPDEVTSSFAALK